MVAYRKTGAYSKTRAGVYRNILAMAYSSDSKGHIEKFWHKLERTRKVGGEKIKGGRLNFKSREQAT